MFARRLSFILANSTKRIERYQRLNLSAFGTISGITITNNIAFWRRRIVKLAAATSASHVSANQTIAVIFGITSAFWTSHKFHLTKNFCVLFTSRNLRQRLQPGELSIKKVFPVRLFQTLFGSPRCPISTSRRLRSRG